MTEWNPYQRQLPCGCTEKWIPLERSPECDHDGYSFVHHTLALDDCERHGIEARRRFLEALQNWPTVIESDGHP